MRACEYCDNELDEEGDCAACREDIRAHHSHYSALFAGQPRYTQEEIEDCYSEPCEYQKRIGALERLGL